MNNLKKVNDKEIVKILHKNVDIDLPFSQDIFLLKTTLAKTTEIKNIDEKIKNIKIGSKLKVLKNNSKRYPDSISIYWDKYVIGYIPNQDSQILSRLLLGGKLLYAKVIGFEKISLWNRIVVEIYLKD